MKYLQRSSKTLKTYSRNMCVVKLICLAFYLHKLLPLLRARLALRGEERSRGWGRRVEEEQRRLGQRHRLADPQAAALERRRRRSSGAVQIRGAARHGLAGCAAWNVQAGRAGGRWCSKAAHGQAHGVAGHGGAGVATRRRSAAPGVQVAQAGSLGPSR